MSLKRFTSTDRSLFEGYGRDFDCDKHSAFQVLAEAKRCVELGPAVRLNQVLNPHDRGSSRDLISLTTLWLKEPHSSFKPDFESTQPGD